MPLKTPLLSDESCQQAPHHRRVTVAGLLTCAISSLAALLYVIMFSPILANDKALQYEEVNAALVMSTIWNGEPAAQMVWEGLWCKYGSDRTLSMSLPDSGAYEVRVIRESSTGQHVEGYVKIENSFGTVTYSEWYRSDKGGFIHRFDNDMNDHKVVVTGSAHSWSSGLFGCSPSKIEVIVSRGAYAVDEHMTKELGYATDELVQIRPGDMLDHKSGHGYSHGMIYLGTQAMARILAERFGCYDALSDITESGHYVIDFGPPGGGRGADSGQEWPSGVKVHKVSIGDDGTWKWKIYRESVGVPLSREAAIQRAFSRFHQLSGSGHKGHTGYNFLYNNCHHFVAWCRYGSSTAADIVFDDLTAGRIRRDLRFPLES